MKILNKRGDMALGMFALAAVMMLGMFLGHRLFRSHKGHQDKTHSAQSQPSETNNQQESIPSKNTP